MLKNTKSLLLIAVSILGFSSCYIYDGPVRTLEEARFLSGESNTYLSKLDSLGPVERSQIKVPKALQLSKKEYVNEVYIALKNGLSEADVTMIEDSIKVLFPNNIVFPKGELYPSMGYEAPLKSFSQLLKKYKKTNILVTGHTDNKGNEVKNKEISTKRASNIKNVVVENGIAESRLKSWGLGSVSPIADNETPEGREKNRRVEFVVLYDEN